MSKESIDLNGKTILVTGSPGFIGANLVLRLLKETLYTDADHPAYHLTAVQSHSLVLKGK